MARLYADENVPLPLVEALRLLGHDVLTSHDAGQAGRGVPDEAVLAFATREGRAVITLNRRDFIRLHGERPDHAGLVVCTVDRDAAGQAGRIHAEIDDERDLAGRLIRVHRPS